MEFVKTDGGLIVPESKPETEPTVDARDGFPVKSGWKFSMCDDRYYQSHEESFRMTALEALYIAVDPGGGCIPNRDAGANRSRRLRLVNELAVELVGGVPEHWEQFT